MKLRINLAYVFLIALSAFTAFTAVAWSQVPVLVVTDQGANGSGNREWLVQTLPATTLLPGSMAVELGFEVTQGTLVSATHDATNWPFEAGHPGNDPFTGAVSFGVNVDTGNGTVFAALGSDPFVTNGFVEVLTIETLGMGTTTLSWGGHTLLPGSANQYVGSRLAQSGMNFDNNMGTLTAMGSTVVTGDFDNDGNWNCADIDALVAEIVAGTDNASFDMNGDGEVTISDINDAGTGWLAVGGSNNPAQTSGNSFLPGDANLDGVVDVSDLNIWSGNKFTTTPGWCAGDFNADGLEDISDLNIWSSNKFQSSDSVNAVPEPAGISLLLMAVLGLWARRR